MGHRTFVCRPEEPTARWLDDATAAGTTAVLVESVSQLPVLAAMANLRGLSIPDDLSVALLVDDPAGDHERQIMSPRTHTLEATVAPPR